MPLFIPAAPVAGEMLIKWRDPNGVLRDLSRNTSPNLFVPAGSAGMGSVKFDITDEKYPLTAGTFIRQINTASRLIELPIVIHEDTFNGALLAAEDLHTWFQTGNESEKTPGYLEVTRPDGSVRKIAAYYTDGLTGDLSQGGPNWFKTVARLYCPDPYPTGE